MNSVESEEQQESFWTKFVYAGYIISYLISFIVLGVGYYLFRKYFAPIAGIEVGIFPPLNFVLGYIFMLVLSTVILYYRHKHFVKPIFIEGEEKGLRQVGIVSIILPILIFLSFIPKIESIGQFFGFLGIFILVSFITYLPIRTRLKQKGYNVSSGSEKLVSNSEWKQILWIFLAFIIAMAIFRMIDPFSAF